MLSNRADLVSGGDALVEVLLAGSGADPVVVTWNGVDVSDQFALRENGRYMGVVSFRSAAAARNLAV